MMTGKRPPLIDGHYYINDINERVYLARLVEGKHMLFNIRGKSVFSVWSPEGGYGSLLDNVNWEDITGFEVIERYISSVTED
jgi:hypothetical protein